MLFNSLIFWVFFAVVYALYLSLGHKWQNRLLFVASLVFYGTWDWRFLFLVFISVLTDFTCSRRIYRSSDIKEKKRYLFLSILVNLTILGFFKYFNFFAVSFQSLLSSIGLGIDIRLMHIILPVGISFYTFQTMSYTIDVYRGKLAPTEKLLDYALFITYFPQLVAGPIERAPHLLKQILSPRRITRDKVYEGFLLISVGLFQKVFIADNLGRLVDPIFASSPPYNGAMVMLGVYAFAFQIYCDFAGYSNIARGLGKCMGFDIMVNFNLPYFSSNPREFWQRWHISLSTWLRDYLYIPLGGSRYGQARTYRNLAITMLLGGLWHGAAWTFVAWGLYHGILLIAHRRFSGLFKRNDPLQGNPALKRIFKYLRVMVFFHFICLGWLIFRAGSMGQAVDMLKAVLNGVSLNEFVYGRQFSLFFFLLLIVLIVQYFQHKKENLLIFRDISLRGKVILGTVILYLCAYAVVMGRLYSLPLDQRFIYFQF